MTTTCAPAIFDAIAPQQVHDAPRGTGQRRRFIEHQAAQVGRVQPIGVLAGVDALQRAFS